MDELEQARQAADAVLELAKNPEELTATEDETIGKLLARNAVAVDRAVAALEALEQRVTRLEQQRHDELSGPPGLSGV